mmetsp:Transcript_31625/g.89867  ORF Transcript_31625/g.89867 Transcript_31625/m.89867 type:complete len:99 (-) Transcript_31625:350-646(-)
MPRRFKSCVFPGASPELMKNGHIFMKKNFAANFLPKEVDEPPPPPPPTSDKWSYTGSTTAPPPKKRRVSSFASFLSDSDVEREEDGEEEEDLDAPSPS